MDIYQSPLDCGVRDEPEHRGLLVQFALGSQVAELLLRPPEARKLLEGLAKEAARNDWPHLRTVLEALEVSDLTADLHGLTPALQYRLAAGPVLRCSLEVDNARRLHEQLGKVLAHIDAVGGVGAQH